MKMALILSLLLTSFTLLGETTLPSRIHDLRHNLALKDVLVFLDSGRVLKLSPEKGDLLDFLVEAHREGSYVVIEHDEKRQILDAEIFLPPDNSSAPEQLVGFEKQNFTPTILPSYSEARNIFRNQRGRSMRNSECYHRAHIWSWEAYKNSGVNSMKVFMFFTQKYILENDYEWWFHVSPMVYVKEGNKVVEYVMDKRFLDGPALIPIWTNIFVRGRSCPEISKYSQYSENQQKESCFLMKFIMHYYQPKDLEALERYNAIKNFWFDWEVKEAYKLGFGVYQ